jgi:hypothetical protein
MNHTGEPREERESQGGGVKSSLSGGDEHSEPESQNTFAPLACTEGHANTEAAMGGGAGRSPAPHSLPLPCLFVTVQTKSHGKRSQRARKAETLFLNVDHLIHRVGIEHCGFFTRTFAENITSRKEAERRNNSWNSGYASKAFEESISVPQRQARGAFHYHDIVVVKTDIRTGFDFESCTAANDLKKKHLHRVNGRLTWETSAHEAEFKRLERKYFASANPNLRALWREIGNSKNPGKAAEYGFGRCELMPILSNAAGCARYVGAYAIAAQNARADEDKGMRTVRYAIKRVAVFCDGRWQKASLRNSTPVWSYAHGGADQWRKGCQVLATLLGGIKYEDMSNVFGNRWAFMLAPFVFICAEHLEELLIDAEAIPFGMTWYRRLRLVRSLLARYDFTSPDTIDLQTAEDHFLTSKPYHLPDYEP